MRLRFTRFASQNLFSAILALACVALVGWIRALPSTLPAANGLAQKVVEMRIREEIAPHIMSHFPAEQWADRIEAAVREKLSENSAQFVAEQQRTVNEIKSEL